MTIDRPDRLFHAFDPSPLSDRELDDKVERFIVHSAQDSPAHEYKMVVHVADQPSEDYAEGLAQAIRAHFGHRRDEEARAIRSLLRDGRQALTVGIAFLVVCGGAGALALKMLPAPLGAFVDEGLLIVGWVANWRPIEIFLYDWRPLRAQQKLLDALSRMKVTFRPTAMP